MKETVYLVISKEGVVAMKKRPPSLKGNERAVQLEVSVPDEVFSISYIMTKLEIHEDDIMNPTVSIMAKQALKEI